MRLPTTITIDFQNKPTQLIPLKTGEIGIPKQSFKLFGFDLFKKRLEIRYHRLWIDITDCPINIEVPDPSKLIVLRHGELCSSLFEDFVIETERYPFEILFDPKQIKDYHDFEDERKIIKFARNAQYTKSDPPDVQEYELEILFRQAYPEPKYSFQAGPDFVTGFEHRKREGIQLGEFSLESVAPVTYSHPMDCKIYVKFDSPFEEDLVYFDIKKIKESDPSIGKKGGLMEEDEEPESDTIKTDSRREITIQNLLPGNAITAPVCVDLDKIENPIDKKEYFSTISIEYIINQQTLAKSVTEKFLIRQDPRITELLTLLIEPNLSFSDIYCHSGKKWNLISKSRWTKADRGQMTCFKFKFGNRAEDGEGVVSISNFSMNFTLAPSSTSRIVPTIGLNDIFRVKNGKGGTPENFYYFPNKPEASETLEVFFHRSNIKDIPDDVATVQCHISFDYLESEDCISMAGCKNAPSASLKSFSYTVLFRVEKFMGIDWLALDFGTSAIVAAFGRKMNETPIDFQKRLKELVTLRKGSDLYNKEDIIEYGTPFLSSAIILKYEGIVSTDDFKKDIVLLSPAFREMVQESRYLIPHLKSLIGSKELPNFNRNFDNYKYRLEEHSKLIEFPQGPIETRTILKNAYRCLVRDFIRPLIVEQQRREEENRDLNKIIITIPNIFTPRHVDFIKSLIVQEFGNFKKDYVLFISESDAVACYYVTQWAMLNQGRDESEAIKYRDGVEHVLVYDMGAGTLDLTYLRIQKKEDGKKEVNIIGRIGKATAGNYLDYIIAKDIFEENESLFAVNLFEDEPSPESMDFQTRHFKPFVRDQIKPNLGIDKEFSIKADEFPGVLKEDLTINTKNIGSGVKKFIRRNTKEIFKNFFTLYNRIDRTEDRPRKKGNFPIDTVVFSGRSIQFGKLRDAIKDDLSDWSANKDIYYIEPDDDKTLKNMVVQGALQFALRYRDSSANVEFVNRNLQARYGVLYEDPSNVGLFRFKELLNPSTRALNEKKPHIKDGVHIYEYDTDEFDAVPSNDGNSNVVDLSNTVEGLFVQSFSVDTAKDMQEGKTEYITKMFKIDESVTDRMKQTVRVVINENNEMIVKIGGFTDDPQSPIKIDINNPAFRHSMWPYI